MAILILQALISREKEHRYFIINRKYRSIQVSDSMRFPNTKLNIKSYNDHSEVSIKTSADNTLNDADLYADVYTLSDGVRIQFRPSSFVLNEKNGRLKNRVN
jgi:hypothetical protein